MTDKVATVLGMRQADETSGIFRTGPVNAQILIIDDNDIELQTFQEPGLATAA